MAGRRGEPTFWRGRSVLVTGAGGFIGSHLAERLVELGARVRALVHYNSLGAWGWLERSPRREEMEVVAGDVAGAFNVAEAMAGVDTVFHLAALIAIPWSYVAPECYVAANVTGTLNVLQAARRSGLRRLVHTSTSEVYGTARRVPIAEDHPLQGQSPYSASKIGADKLAEAFHLSFGLPVAVIRPFNTFGPRQSARAVLPTVLVQALAGRRRIRLGALAPKRDFNFVSDTVEGFVLVAEADAAVGRVINVGSGREVAIGEAVALAGRVLGRELEAEEEEARIRPAPSEVMRLQADISLARELLGYEPAVGFEEGLDRTARWLGENLAAYKADRYVL